MSESISFAKSPYNLKQPAWSKNSVIYQVNTRQFSKTGDFKGVQSGLEHIKSLGADVVWLMPIHPIGQKHRKGTLGSPYSVRDYFAVNSEFGNEDDFTALVKRAHQLDLKIILDWVANHSAWDNPLVENHPDWYAKDHHGNFRPSPWWDWDDIVEFDYSQRAVRAYMLDAMAFWVEKFDVDGFRCDVAGYVPKEFWEQARARLNHIKPVFMLAEWESRELHENAFNMTYAWSWNETLHGIAMQGWSLDKLRKYYSWNERAWPVNAYRMTFVSNHDKNAWDGTQVEQFGDALFGAIVLSVLGEGVPLIHNGQEAGETKRLAFFERDPIEWQPHAIGDLYRRLIAWKKQVPALWNGPFGATMIPIPNSQMETLFSFVRQQNDEKVLVVINFSDLPCSFVLKDELCEGEYIDMTNDETRIITVKKEIKIDPWAFLALYSRQQKLT